MHQLTQTENFSNHNSYQDFINWVSAEFDLYLQDYKSDLSIFYPDGRLSIKKVNEQNDTVVAEINIECSQADVLKKISNQLFSVLTVFKKNKE